MFKKKDQSSQSALTIPYDRELLWGIIEEISSSATLQKQLTAYLDIIEEQVSIIHKSLISGDAKNTDNIVEQTLTNIRNAADSLFTNTQNYHPTLPNTLRRVILQWIEPVEVLITARKSKESNKELGDKTTQLYIQQNSIQKYDVLNQMLNKHFNEINSLHAEPGKPRPVCYIVYADPAGPSKLEEFWVKPFLCALYDHLKAAGIRPIMDIKDLNPGDNSSLFLRQFGSGNDVILIGTESLQYCSKMTEHSFTQNALAIVSRQLRTNKNVVYPLLLSGKVDTAFPKEFGFSSDIATGYQGYLSLVKQLIGWLLRKRLSAKKEQYEQLWEEFCKRPQFMIEDFMEKSNKAIDLQHSNFSNSPTLFTNNTLLNNSVSRAPKPADRASETKVSLSDAFASSSLHASHISAKEKGERGPTKEEEREHAKILKAIKLSLEGQAAVLKSEQKQKKAKESSRPNHNFGVFSQQPAKQSSKAAEKELFDLCWEAKDMARIHQLLSIPGININQQHFLDDTCLMRAARKGHKELVRLLLQNNADKSIRAFSGVTAADVASSPDIKHLIESWNDKLSICSL